METPQTVATKATKEQRISAILSAIATLGAELGPLFIHSDHAQKVLAQASTVVAVLGAAESAAA